MERKNWQMMAGLWKQAEVIELSHVMENGMPIPGDLSKYYHEMWSSYDLGDGCLSYQIVMNEHSGTHVDAPCHMLKKSTGHQIFLHEEPVKKYSFPCAVIVLPKGECEPVTVADIQAWENENGDLRPGEGVFFHTGWESRWKIYDPEQAFLKNWPGVSREAAEYLVSRGIAAVGTDCLSIDYFGAEGSPLPAHEVFLSADVPIFENLIHLQELPERCFVMSLPLRIQDGTASPVRVIAVI